MDSIYHKKNFQRNSLSLSPLSLRLKHKRNWSSASSNSIGSISVSPFIPEIRKRERDLVSLTGIGHRNSLPWPSGDLFTDIWLAYERFLPRQVFHIWEFRVFRRLLLQGKFRSHWCWLSSSNSFCLY